MLLAFTLLALCLAPAATAAAQTADYPPDEGGLELSRNVLPPGGTLELAAPGFCAGSDVEIFLLPFTEADRTAPGAEPRIELSPTPVDGDGDVSVLVTTPGTAAPGEYELTVKGLDTDCSTVKRVSAKIELTGPGGKPQDTAAPAAAPGSGAGSTGLAFTGLELWLLLGAGAALLVGGLLVRRRTAEGAG